MLKDGASHRRNLRQAFIASIDRAIFDPVMLALRLARFAIGHAIRKSLLPEMLKASLVIGELTVKILDCVSKMSGNRLPAVHDATNLAKY
ncbi:MAG: hypothetical protein WA824_06090 [Candidatus Sulfotelmatobacter sp.]